MAPTFGAGAPDALAILESGRGVMPSVKEPLKESALHLSRRFLAELS
jgi:hypothetical protein